MLLVRGIESLTVSSSRFVEIWRKKGGVTRDVVTVYGRGLCFLCLGKVGVG